MQSSAKGLITFSLSLFLCLNSFPQGPNGRPAKASAQKQAKSDYNRFAGLDTAFARVLKEWKAPGFAVAVVEKNKVVYAKGFGYKDWEARKPVTENTVFAIGSCTKAFTAALLGILNDEGKVRLDIPATTYLPELHFYTAAMDNQITLRDMMCHRTGIPRYDWSWGAYPSASRDTLMRRVRYMEPTQPLRQKFQYNNFMFMLQGMVAEKLTGASWEASVREKFFAPLGMTHSNLTLNEWKQEGDLALGYRLKDDSLIRKTAYDDEGGMGPAGSITSTVTDMARWLRLWIQGGRYEGRQLLPAKYVTEAISSQMVADAALPTSELPDLQLANIGLGWFLSSYRGHYRVEHGGNVTGFSASTCFFPTDSIGIVVLCNQDGSAVPGVVRNLLADRMLGTGYRDWQSLIAKRYQTAKAAAAEPKAAVLDKIHPPTHPLQDYIGTYAAPAGETFTVWLKGDSLFLTTPAGSWWCRHYNYDAFELLSKDGESGEIDTSVELKLKAVFQTDESGEIASVSCVLPEGSGKPVVFWKKKERSDNLSQK